MEFIVMNYSETISKLLQGWIFAITLILLSSCSTQDSRQQQESVSQWFKPNHKVKVLTTTEMINNIVQLVGGEFVDSIALIHGQLDPHSYQLVKGDDEKLSFASIIFYNGLGLEHGPSLQHFLQIHENAIPIGNRIQQQDPSLILHVNGQEDPHIWMDMSLWAKSIPIVVETLSAKDPEHSAQYRANGQIALQTLLNKHAEIKQLLQSIDAKKRYLVTSHDAFNYFTKAYLAEEKEISDNSWENRFAAPEGLAPESQLSTTDIQKIIDHMHQFNIHVIFPESNVSKDSIRKIVMAGKEKGLQLMIVEDFLYGDAMGSSESDGNTYVNMMTHNAKTIAKYLQGTYKND